MPSFQYTAVDRQGTDTRGTVVAAHRQAAIDQLAGRGMFVTELLLSGEGEGGGSSNGRPAPEDRPNRTAAPSGLRVNLRSRVAIWRQLATSLEAGLPLLTALKVVEEQAEKPAVRELVGDLAKRVQRGDSLAEAMEAHPAAFGRMQLSMIRAGETAGVLDEVTASLAQFAERDLKVRERIRSASTYPVLVLGLAAVSVVLILTVVLPAILEGVTEAGGQIPLPTRILMGVSDLLLYWGWLLALIGVGAFFWFRRWVDTPEGRLAVDRLKLKIPVLGTTLRKVAVARFARALGTLTGAGIQILEALSVLRDSLGNEALAQEV
ncbi:MAG: type II secretion system F family protein, partial [Phycisphaeraceae bacterium]